MRTTLSSMLASPLQALPLLSRVTGQCSKDRIFPDLAKRTSWSHDRPDFVPDTGSAVGVEIRVFCETAFSRDGLREGPLLLAALRTGLIARIVDDSRIPVERPLAAACCPTRAAATGTLSVAVCLRVLQHCATKPSSDPYESHSGYLSANGPPSDPTQVRYTTTYAPSKRTTTSSMPIWKSRRLPKVAGPN